MNRDTMKGKWKQMKGAAKVKWGKLTDDSLDQVEGNVDKLIGLVQERYGYERDRAEREVDDFMNAHADEPQTPGHTVTQPHTGGRA